MKFIGCSRWWDKSKEGKHYFERIKNDIVPKLVRKLFNDEIVSNKFITFIYFIYNK